MQKKEDIQSPESGARVQMCSCILRGCCVVGVKMSEIFYLKSVAPSYQA